MSDQDQRDQRLLDTVTGRHSRRQFMTRAGAVGLSAAAVPSFLTGCGSTSSTTSVNLAGPIPLDTLIKQAKKEGELQASGIPPEWANYATILAGYAAAYVPVIYKAEAEFSSAQEVNEFKLSKTHPHDDIADVGFIWGPTVIQEGLVTPYKHAYWNDVPSDLKDPDGNWCTEYWGAQALVVNTDLVKNPPTSFADLLTNDYPNMVGIDGDPRQATDALDAVYAAALATSGSTASIQPGIEFFAKLKAKGNFTLARANEANIVKGEVAIAIIWDYLGLGYRDTYASSHPQLTVTIPSDGSIAGPYILIINKTAPDPYAGRLWSEYIFSDTGQLDFLTGYAHPVRYNVLEAAGKIPAALAAKLPPAASYANVQFVANPSLLTAAGNALNANWQSQVLGS